MFFNFFYLKKKTKSMFKLLRKNRGNFTQKHIKSPFNEEKSLVYEKTLINTELFIKLTLFY